MTYEFAKYTDGTLGVFSNIGKNENGEEYVRITFERPTNYGFDTYIIDFLTDMFDKIVVKIKEVKDEKRKE